MHCDSTAMPLTNCLMDGSRWVRRILHKHKQWPHVINCGAYHRGALRWDEGEEKRSQVEKESRLRSHPFRRLCQSAPMILSTKASFFSHFVIHFIISRRHVQAGEER